MQSAFVKASVDMMMCDMCMMRTFSSYKKA